MAAQQFVSTRASRRAVPGGTHLRVERRVAGSEEIGRHGSGEGSTAGLSVVGLSEWTRARVSCASASESSQVDLCRVDLARRRPSPELKAARQADGEDAAPDGFDPPLVRWPQRHALLAVALSPPFRVIVVRSLDAGPRHQGPRQPAFPRLLRPRSRLARGRLVRSQRRCARVGPTCTSSSLMLDCRTVRQVLELDKELDTTVRDYKAAIDAHALALTREPLHQFPASC